MKVTYIEELENKTALDRNKYCICGQHEYQIVKQLKPVTAIPWSIRCPYCSNETKQYSILDGAIREWKTMVGNVVPKKFTRKPRAFAKC